MSSYHQPRKPPEWVLEKVRRSWDIDPIIGVVRRKHDRREIGSIEKGYCVIKAVQGFRYLRRSHLVWWEATGKWPTELLDHKDRNSSNDKIENLRYATVSVNRLNSADTRLWYSRSM